MKLLDFLLFPKSLYQKLTAKKPVLFLGVLFVGLADIIFRLAVDKFHVFTGKSREILTYNLLVLAGLVIILGFVDILFFSLPLADLFKLFKKEKELSDQRGALVRIMKIYVISHLIIVPVQVLIYMVLLGDAPNMGLMFFAGFLDLALPFWFCAAITRGINTVYDFQPLFKRLVFAVVLLWSYILGYVFSFAVDRWVMQLFK